MSEVVTGQLKRSEVTEFYRISRTTLWRLAKTGKLKQLVESRRRVKNSTHETIYKSIQQVLCVLTELTQPKNSK